MYEIFEQLLKERGLSIAEFSRLTGIAKSTLSDWKKGKFQLKDSKRRVIADFFGVTLDYLDGRTDKRDTISQSSRGIASTINKITENGQKVAKIEDKKNP